MGEDLVLRYPTVFTENKQTQVREAPPRSASEPSQAKQCFRPTVNSELITKTNKLTFTSPLQSNRENKNDFHLSIKFRLYAGSLTFLSVVRSGHSASSKS